MKVLTTTLFFLISIFSFSQDWKIEYRPSSSFVESQGQFKSNNSDRIGGIRYAVDCGSTRILFGTKGVSFDFMEANKKSEDESKEQQLKESSSIEEYKENEKSLGKFTYKFDDVSFIWENANSDVQVEGINLQSDYHSYSFKDQKGKLISKNKIKGFEKIRYNNIYPGIDIEYSIHPENGIKYALFLEPGADPRKVKMLYDEEVLLKNGIVHIPTQFGDIKDHEPLTFYKDDRNEVIESKFVNKGRTIQFQLDGYDSSREVVIDPWVQTPSFNTDWDCIWEIEYDGAGNVYAIGGTMPMVLQKYDPTGSLMWTYNTPYDTTDWLGGFGTDDLGNSYVTRGSVAGITKVNTTGAVEWTNNGSGTLGDSDEYWNVQFSCDESKVIIGGTRLSGFGFTLQPAIFDIDVNNGNVLNTVIVHPASGLPAREVRSLSASPESRYYWLAHDTIGYLSDNLTGCNGSPANVYKINNDMGLSYKCENYRYDNSGIMALKADENFLYVNRGDEIQKRDLQTLAIINTATIPNGAFSANILGNFVENSGIDVDDCGHIFVGSSNQVVEYDNNLNQVNTYPTSFKVYDVHVAPNGRLIAGGSTGDSGSNTRVGYIQQWNVGACSPLALTCCDANICEVDDFCESDAPVSLTSSTPGGTWSGPGVNASGNFDPSVAGSGTHTITYTLPCGSSSVDITVNPCSTLDICVESNGDLTVTNGTGPYTWEEEVTTTTPITNQTECQDCGYTWVGFGPLGDCFDGGVGGTQVTDCSTTGWSVYATGTTTTPPGSLPIQVTDDAGASVIITDLSSLPACGSNPCAGVTINFNVDNQTDVSCFGDTDGTATVSASGGDGNYTYSWSPGGLTGASQTGLAPNTYTIDVTDGNGCTGSGTVTIGEPAALAANPSSIDATCGASDGEVSVAPTGGDGNYTYSWSPGGQTTATVSNVPAGSYDVTITDGNGCSLIETITVTTTNGPTISIDAQSDASCFGDSDGSATVSATGGTAPYTFTWNPGGLTGATQNGLSAGTYTIEAEDDAGCISSTTVTINEPAEIQLTTSSTTSSCTTPDGSATVSATGGDGNYTYSWSPGGQTTATINNIAAGAYTVTVTDGNGCTADEVVNVQSTNGPVISVDNTSDISCFGDADGSATISVTGGTSPFIYGWSPSGGNAATANGLDAGTYIVTVTDDAGCVSTETIVITEPDPLVLTGNVIDADCAASNGQVITTTTGGTGTYTYSWSPNNETTANLTGVGAGTYDVTVTDTNGCTSTETFIVDQGDTVDVDIVPNSATIQAGDQVLLNVTINPTVTNPTYTWTPIDGLSCTNCPDPTASPNQTTTYTVTVTSDEGCVGVDQVTINVVEPCSDPFLPNMFSPNEDGINDQLCFYGTCIQAMTLQIYNRWGEKVFESSTTDDCWDGKYRGKYVNSGTYVYKVRYTVFGEQEVVESGNLTVVR